MTKPTEQSMIIDGIGAAETVDSSGEILSIKGCDISSLQEGKGVLNWEHQSAGVKDKTDSPKNAIGKIIYAHKIYKEDDCENDRQRFFWNKVKVPLIYIKARLFDGSGHEDAKAAAASFRDAVTHKEAPLINFSIEGHTIEKEGNKLLYSMARAVAATHKPCNKAAVSSVMYDPITGEHGVKEIKEQKADSDLSSLLEVEKNEVPGRRTLSSVPIDYDPVVEEDPRYLLKCAVETLKKGAMGRMAPWNPSQATGKERGATFRWQDGNGERDSIPEMDPNARLRAAHHLHTQTQARTGKTGREFLLYRGMSEPEHDTAHNNGTLQYGEHTSWTPKRDLAEQFGGEYKGKVVGAWVPESAIHAVPRQLGILGQGRATKGPNDLAAEHEIIVKPGNYAVAQEGLAKTLTAGFTGGAPGTLSGGSCLQREDLKQVAKKKLVKTFLKNQFYGALRDYEPNSKQTFKQFLKSRLPEVDDEFIDYFNEIAEGLKMRKDRPPIKFPKLGAGDDRRETMPVNTPGALKQKTHAMALAVAKVNHPGGAPQSAVEAQKDGLSRALGAAWGSNSWAKGRGLPDRGRLPAAYEYVRPKEKQTVEAKQVQGTMLHEDQHNLFERAAKYVDGNMSHRGILAQNLLAAIPKEHQQAVEDFYKWRVGGTAGPNEHEEKVAHLVSFLNDPAERAQYHAAVGNIGHPLDAFELKMKQAYTYMQAAAETANANWITGSEPWGWGQSARARLGGRYDLAAQIEKEARLKRNATLGKSEDDSVRRLEFLAIELKKAATMTAPVMTAPMTNSPSQPSQPKTPMPALAPRVTVDGHAHTDPKIHIHPLQHEMVHGLDLQQPQHKAEADGISTHVFPTSRVKTPNGQHAVMKKGGPHWNTPSTAHTEVVYSNIARDFFGLGDHVPTTAHFEHPDFDQSPYSVQGFVTNGRHFGGTPEDQMAINQHGDSGHLDKMALMDSVMGNGDRHEGNYMLDHTGKVHLIDHGYALDFSSKDMYNPEGNQPYTPGYLERYHEQKTGTASPSQPFSPIPDAWHGVKLHPQAAEWAMGLSPQQLTSQLRSQGVEPKSAMAAGWRLKGIQRLIGQKGYDTGVWEAWNHPYGPNSLQGHALRGVQAPPDPDVAQPLASDPDFF